MLEEIAASVARKAVKASQVQTMIAARKNPSISSSSAASSSSLPQAMVLGAAGAAPGQPGTGAIVAAQGQPDTVAPSPEVPTPDSIKCIPSTAAERDNFVNFMRRALSAEANDRLRYCLHLLHRNFTDEWMRSVAAHKNKDSLGQYCFTRIDECKRLTGLQKKAFVDNLMSRYSPQ